jgi:hypothetical protein
VQLPLWDAEMLGYARLVERGVAGKGIALPLPIGQKGLLEPKATVDDCCRGRCVIAQRPWRNVLNARPLIL